MNTQQKQEQARIRRQQEKILRYHNQYFATQRFGRYNWARVGLYNVRHEIEHSANYQRLYNKKTAIEFGNHWMCWDHNGQDFIGYVKEIVKKDNLGQITHFIYEDDFMSFTPHALERLWERKNIGIDAVYQPSVGIENLLHYVRGTYGFTKVMDEVAFRKDIIVPYAGGCFLGSSRLTTGSFGGGWLSNTFRRYTTAAQENYRFCAETWISEDMMRPEQIAVCDLIKNDRMQDAVDYMRALPVRNCEAFDPEQIEVMKKEVEALQKPLDDLVKNA